MQIDSGWNWTPTNGRDSCSSAITEPGAPQLASSGEGFLSLSFGLSLELSLVQSTTSEAPYTEFRRGFFLTFHASASQLAGFSFDFDCAVNAPLTLPSLAEMTQVR